MTQVKHPEITMVSKGSGTDTIGTSFAKVTMDTTVVSSPMITFDNSNDTLKVHSDGWYLCRGELIIEMGSASPAGNDCQIRLQEGVGGIFIDIPGAESWCRVYYLGDKHKTACTAIRQLNANDEVRMVVKKNHSTMSLFADPQSTLMVELIRTDDV